MSNPTPGSSSSYLPNLTGVRGLAAVWVLAFHGWQFSNGPSLVLPFPGFALDLTPLFKCGYFGVDLFFVLSGFLLSMPFHRAALEGRPWPSLKQFWIHRCRRVLPAYWLQLLILTVVLAYLGQFARITPQILVAHAALVQNIVPWLVPLLNPVYWSMPVEWDFYVVLPLLALIVARCRWPLAMLLALTFVFAFRVLCYWSLTDTTIATVIGYGDVQQLPARLDQFFVGICAAWITVSKPPSARGALAWLLGGIGVIVAMAYVAAPRNDFLVNIDVPYLFFHHSVTAIAFGMLVLGAAGTTRAGAALFANRPMTFLGLISYSLYLWHYPTLQLAQYAGLTSGVRAPAWALVLAIAVPVILLVSWLSYRYVERPFLRPDKQSSAPAAGTAPPPSERVVRNER
ncbi:MAG TPA: acyltransferase [Rudaea sp.]|nr:acyltransferase [Rudaea sp.]